ncbi:MAG: hypothetical protein AAF922_18870 [Pseudomonadota bacterium]
MPDQIADGNVWHPNAPAAEDDFALRTQRHLIEERLREWDSYRNKVLGPIRDMYKDEEIPFQSPNDLQDALVRIEEMIPELPTISAPTQDTPNIPNTGSFALDLPTKLG